jgi:hypothetical protein
MLGDRTLKTVKAVHILRQGDNFTCLDVNVEAHTVDEALAAVGEWVQSVNADPDAVLPSAAEQLWEQFRSLPILETRHILLPTPRVNAIVIVRGEGS